MDFSAAPGGHESFIDRFGNWILNRKDNDAKMSPDLQRRFRELKAEYQIMNGPPSSAPQVIQEVLSLSDRDATLVDVFILERGYAAALPPEYVAGAVQNWRLLYRGIVGDAEFADYLATKPIDPTSSDVDSKIARLRSDLCWLIDRVHYLYTVTPAKDAVQNLISARLMVLTAFAFVSLGTYAIVRVVNAHHTAVGGVNLLLAVIFFGAIGGFISAQTRLQSSTGTDPLFKRFELYESRWIINILSPVEGAVFALILYMMLAGNLLGDGAVFPAFPKTDRGVGNSLAGFLIKVHPMSGMDVAKLLVWSFIAGFAEKFVPDALTRFSSGDYFGSQKKV